MREPEVEDALYLSPEVPRSARIIELFLKHVVLDTPWHWDLLAGARGVQLAELGLRSAREGRRLSIPDLEL